MTPVRSLRRRPEVDVKPWRLAVVSSASGDRTHLPGEDTPQPASVHTNGHTGLYLYQSNISALRL